MPRAASRSCLFLSYPLSFSCCHPLGWTRPGDRRPPAPRGLVFTPPLENALASEAGLRVFGRTRLFIHRSHLDRTEIKVADLVLVPDSRSYHDHRPLAGLQVLRDDPRDVGLRQPP